MFCSQKHRISCKIFRKFEDITKLEWILYALQNNEKYMETENLFYREVLSMIISKFINRVDFQKRFHLRVIW